VYSSRFPCTPYLDAYLCDGHITGPGETARDMISPTEMAGVQARSPRELGQRPAARQPLLPHLPPEVHCRVSAAIYRHAEILPPLCVLITDCCNLVTRFASAVRSAPSTILPGQTKIESRRKG
jgi:hypothetical protein